MIETTIDNLIIGISRLKDTMNTNKITWDDEKNQVAVE